MTTSKWKDWKIPSRIGETVTNSFYSSRWSGSLITIRPEKSFVFQRLKTQNSSQYDVDAFVKAVQGLWFGLSRSTLSKAGKATRHLHGSTHDFEGHKRLHFCNKLGQKLQRENESSRRSTKTFRNSAYFKVDAKCQILGTCIGIAQLRIVLRD